MLNVLFFFLMLGLINYVIYSFIVGYKRTGKVLGAFRHSATILWARFVALVGASAGVLAGLADTLNMPEVREVIQSVMKPEYVAFFIIFIAVITEWARSRTLGE